MENITIKTHTTFSAFMAGVVEKNALEAARGKASFFPSNWFSPSPRPMTDEEIRRYVSEGVEIQSALDEYEQEAKDQLMAHGRIQEAETFEVVRQA